MKKWSLIMSLCLFSLTTHADFAVIEDPDGFVNVRKEPRVSAPVAYNLTDEPFYVMHKNGNGFYEVFSKNNSDLDGGYFIHSSRVRFIRTFPKLKSSYNSKADSINLTGFGYVVSFSSKHFDRDAHALRFANNDEFSLTSLDGFSVFWGSDAAVPHSEYKKFDIKFLGQTIKVSKEIKGDLFNPTIKNSKAFFDKSTEKLYLLLENGDGAGVYHVVIVVKNGVVIDRLVVLDENI